MDNVCVECQFTFAVPLIVFVKADVYLTCKNMAILIPKPVIPVIVYLIRLNKHFAPSF